MDQKVVYAFSGTQQYDNLPLVLSHMTYKSVLHYISISREVVLTLA